MANYFEAEIAYKYEDTCFEKRFLVINLQSHILYIYEHREQLRYQQPKKTLSLGQHQYIVSPSADDHDLILTIKKQRHLFQFDSPHALQQFIDILKSSMVAKTSQQSHSHVPFRLNTSRLHDQTSMIQLSNFTKKCIKKQIGRKQKDTDDLIVEYLQKACDIYWNESNKKEVNDGKEDEEVDEYPLMDEMDPMTKLVLGINKTNHKQNKKSLYLNDDDFAAMKWPMYLEFVIKKTRNWRCIYTNCHRIFSLKQYDNAYHENDTLSQNEILDFLWIYVGFCYWNVKTVEFTLGHLGIMLDFLSKLNHLFKCIIIAYDFEITYYGKILNHCMKTYLKNINGELLYRAQQIYQRKIIPNKESTAYQSLKTQYDLLKFRMDACKLQLRENGIVLQKM
eukprot:906073_1